MNSMLVGKKMERRVKRLFIFIQFFSLSFLSTMAQPKMVAHRGYWRTEGSWQNTLTSLLRADELGCYGSEFDVWLTADGIPVVFHDAQLDGKRIEDCTYSDLQFYQMKNGEFLPTLQQYLQLGKSLPDTQLILEIKEHSTAERNDNVADVTVRLVHQLGLESQVEYISFSRHVCERLHQSVPEAKIAYLTGDLSPKQVSEMGISGIDYNENVFRQHPEWLKEASQLGLEVNVWTVDGEENLRNHVNNPGIDLITTNDPDMLKGIIQEQMHGKNR